MFICVHFKGRCCCMMLHCLFTYFICRSCCNFILLLVFTVQRYARAMLALALCLSVSISVTHQCFGEIAEWIELVSSMALLLPIPHCVVGRLRYFQKQGTSPWNFATISPQHVDILVHSWACQGHLCQSMHRGWTHIVYSCPSIIML